jgi:GABA(A) receptor-associated protein
MSSNQSDTTADVSMITLQQANINLRKKSVIDFNKLIFTDEENTIIRKEVEVIKEKYPHYIPIVVRPNDNKTKLLKCKFLVGGDITIGQFLSILRRKMENLKSSEAIYLFINNSLPPATSFLSTIYAENQDKNTGMLYITVCKENTFG